MTFQKNIFHYYNDISVIKSQTKVKTFIYDFANHFHPFVNSFITELNKESLEGLLDPVFQDSLKKDFFKKTYLDGSLQDGDNNFIVQYDKKEVDLSSDGAYSVYNWELFYHAPIMVAVHLSKNQRFAEAQKWFHFIFDPTTTDTSVKPPRCFWKFLEFRKQTTVMLIDELMKSLSKPEDSKVKSNMEKSIAIWQKKPFRPHVIARNRFLAYQFYVVMKYLDNLIAWGDALFRQDTMETVNEATQIYVLAANILGPQPQQIPRLGKIQPKTYKNLRNKLDDFSNALVEMEGQFPFNLNVPGTSGTGSSQARTLYGTTSTLYFCIPPNPKLLGYWDTVADRLFKIRHCMNIEGIVRQLPLFQPPIDPGMLVKAVAAGIDISSVAAGLNQPVSQVRAQFLIRKALEICSEVKGLGAGLLSALEKQDHEAMALLRQGHEIKILKLVEDVKYLQWKEAEAATSSLLKTRDTAFQRYYHYQRLLAKSESDINAIKTVSIERKELTEENFDEVYDELVGNYGEAIGLDAYRPEKRDTNSPADMGDGADLQLNSNENLELNTYMPQAHSLQQASGTIETIASVFAMIPQIAAHATPIGVGAAVGFGGEQLSKMLSIMARLMRLDAERFSYEGTRAAKLAGYERRMDDWIFQSNLAASELMQIGRQIISSLIREQIVKWEYEHHKKQIEHSKEIDEFLKDKFTNKDFYTWMQGEISKIYYDCYKFAFDIAKKAEQTMKHEIMRKELDDVTYIKFNYWDSGRKGLLSGETMYLDLKRMEMAYHDHNQREYELIKHISLRRLDPNALLELKTEGSCQITIPEWLFDIDCPGHYMRRIKRVSISIPCVTGPYTSLNCTLSLHKSTLRKSPLLSNNKYDRLGTSDSRFKDYYGTIQSIVTSHGQNDGGLFDPDFRDERYLPFEGTGAESTWNLELPTDFKQFDYNTISDVIIHLRYTAREGGSVLKTGAVKYVKGLIKNSSDLAILFSLSHDFPTEWHRFQSTTNEVMKITINSEHFPYMAQGFTIKIQKAKILYIKKEKVNTDQSTITMSKTTLKNNEKITLTVPGNSSVKNEEVVFLILEYQLT